MLRDLSGNQPRIGFERLDIARGQLVVVDIQERLLPHIHEHAELLVQAGRMVQAARVLGMPITISEQYPKGLGRTAPAIRAAAGMDGGSCGDDPAGVGAGPDGAGRDSAGGVARVEKMTFSFCADASCRQRLTQLARPQVLLVGIETHVCVQQTALDLLEMGMRPVVLADAVGSRRRRDYEVALDYMRAAGAIVTTVESVIFQLVHESGTDLFKRILPLVR